MNIPTEYILASFGGLTTVISVLASIIYKALSSEISSLRKIVSNLQEDVDRLSRGCGMQSCIWKLNK
jgi:hypothetical protein